MGSIKPLPEDVRNSVRSGIILSDLTRVVEELVFNSLDAGATKVSVWVNVGTCYVKVMDNGTGISRDELSLLGERYATSKLHHIGDMDVTNGTFGSRGEALASISDVSLLEIVTKAYGRPNGYRKVIKGSKCLYVGIDDDRRDVGTTVVVRDLFYNQPVRRKYMQSSPKKVLHSVKKCVLRISLVHTKVAFKVLDIESEDELFCTHPSTSPLPLLMSCFGIEDSSSLQELNVSDGVLKLTGYISGPSSSFPIKVFQYVYINSRFICKGPIHKLLNHLATKFENLDLWKANSESQRGKKNKPLTCPAYIVNLSCSHSLYDLTFEPSKTCVEFKDWVPILTFIEKAILRFWRKNMAYGESFPQETDLAKNGREQVHNIRSAQDFSNTAVRKCGIQNHQAYLDLPSPPSKMLSKENSNLFHRKLKQNLFQELLKNISQHDGKLTDKEFVGQTDYAFKPMYGPLAKCTANMSQRSHESYDNLWISDSNLLSIEDYSLTHMFTAAQESADCVEGRTASSTRQDKPLEVEFDNGSKVGPFSLDCHERSDDVEISNSIQKAFLQSGSSKQNLSLDRAMFASDEGFGFQISDFKMKRKRAFPDDMANIPDVDIVNQRFDFFSRTPWQDGMSTNFDLLPIEPVKLFPSYEEHFVKENNLSYHPFTPIRNSSSNHNSLGSDWCSLAFEATVRNVENFTSKNALVEGSCRPSKRANYGYCLDDEQKDGSSSYEIIKNSWHDSCTAFCTEAPSEFQNYDDFGSNFCESLDEDKPCNKISPEHWFCIDSFGEDSAGIDRYERQKHLKYPVRTYTPKARSMRSHSAPPFYRQKRRFISLNNHLMMEAGKESVHAVSGELKLPNNSASTSTCSVHAKPNLAVDSLPNCRSEMKIKDTEPAMNDIRKDEKLEPSNCLQFNDTSPLQDFDSTEFQDSTNSESKWRNSFLQIANNNKSHGIHVSTNILNISSGFPHLAADSLIPESITKGYLKDAKVLQQVDKKFIPVVSGGILAIIDQHAADERIRLEELREKVLSGKARSSTYLDAEQELVLPEIGYQLLDNYVEQITEWGWICNIHARDSRSFKKSMDLMHRRPTVVTLLAVPCVLGVKLTDMDLLEFLQQLSDTDGSSTVPPSVLRVLNYKACRGAIMFGDSLLPSECSLIVEELKQTSLCFQCAHGRRTTVPLVNLNTLRKEIPKLGLSKGSSWESWHGLQRHELSLERTARRLKIAMARGG